RERLDAFGGRIQRRSGSRLTDPVPVAGCCISAFQAGQFGFGRLQLLPGLRQLVRNGERGHDGQSRVANFTESRAQSRNALVEILSKARESHLLAVLASHAELASSDSDIDLRHAVFRYPDAQLPPASSSERMEPSTLS